MQEFRPMSISEILDVTFRLYREHFATFLIIALIVYLPYSLLAAFVLPMMGGAAVVPVPGGPPQFNPGPMILMFAGLFLLVVIFLPLCVAALTQNISAAYLGQKLSAAESYQRTMPRLGALILTQLLAGIVILIGYCLLIVPGIIFSLWFFTLAPVIILEGVSGSAALGRSRELMRGNLGKAFGLALLLWILGVIIGFILGFVLGFIPWPSPMLGVFFQNLANALVLPIQTAPIVLLYYDLRIRKEAFDLQMLASAMEPPATTSSGPWGAMLVLVTLVSSDGPALQGARTATALWHRISMNRATPIATGPAPPSARCSRGGNSPICTRIPMRCGGGFWPGSAASFGASAMRCEVSPNGCFGPCSPGWFWLLWPSSRT